MTPAITAGVTDSVWNTADVIAVLEAKEENTIATLRAEREIGKDAKFGPGMGW